MHPYGCRNSSCSEPARGPLQARSYCLQAGVAAHGCVDHELWLQYASFEQKHLKGARNVYWRAVKALAQPDDFVAMYSGRGT